ncbi:hypothetical protein TMatcc_008174 [Talaromyces marneffei ATCC 18224]
MAEPIHTQMEFQDMSILKSITSKLPPPTRLMELSNNNSKCWGSKHSDTKGGTWQVGSGAISYHALGEKAPLASPRCRG